VRRHTVISIITRGDYRIHRKGFRLNGSFPAIEVLGSRELRKLKRSYIVTLTAIIQRDDCLRTAQGHPDELLLYFAFPMVQSVQERRHEAFHELTSEYLPPALHLLSEFPLSMHRATQSFLMPYC